MSVPAPDLVSVPEPVAMASVIEILPAPVKVKLEPISLIVVDALSIVNVPRVLPTVVAPEKVMSPVSELFPELFKIAPALLTPTPTAVIFSAIETPPCNAKDALLEIEVIPAVVPKAVLFAAMSVPALIVVLPIYSLAPLNIKEPNPDLTREPVPEIIPLDVLDDELLRVSS